MIVLDASTAILLAKSGLLDVFLRHAGPTVWMPKEVQAECSGRDSLDARLIAYAILQKKILVKAAGGASTLSLAAEFGLGRGEAAAIALALSKGALVATDDKRAINACKVLRISFSTAVSVLVRMKEKGLIGSEDAFTALQVLRREGRYKKEIIEVARAALEKQI